MTEWESAKTSLPTLLICHRNTQKKYKSQKSKPSRNTNHALTIWFVLNICNCAAVIGSANRNPPRRFSGLGVEAPASRYAAYLRSPSKASPAGVFPKHQRSLFWWYELAFFSLVFFTCLFASWGGFRTARGVQNRAKNQKNRLREPCFSKPCVLRGF